MRAFFHQHSEDLKVMADLRGDIGREDLLKMRRRIDRMRSQYLRQATLAIWNEKAKVFGAISATSPSLSQFGTTEQAR